MGKTKLGKGTKLMAVTDAAGLVLSVSIASASPHEVGLVEQALEERFIEPMPQRLIGDRAYDSDPLDEKLKKKGVELIAPQQQGEEKDAERAKAQALQEKMESGALLCLALQLPDNHGQARVQSGKLTGLCPAGLHENHAEVFLRQLLVDSGVTTSRE